MEHKNNKFAREFIYKKLLLRLLDAAEKNSEAEPDNEYYSNAVEVLQMLLEGCE